MTTYDEIKRAILAGIDHLTAPQVQRLIDLLSNGDFDTLFPPKAKANPFECLNRGRWREWVARDRIVSRLPEDQQYTSWLIWHHTGIAPYGSKKSWAAAVTDLLESAGGWTELVEEAIKKGKEARMKDGMTLKGPRSFIGWVRDLRSKRELEKVEQMSLIDLDVENDNKERVHCIDFP